MIKRSVHSASQDAGPHDDCAHTHSKDENVTVLVGSVVHETGKSLIKANGMALGTGGFVYLPAHMPQSLWTNANAAEIQVTGSGPFGVTYVNPDDDPSKAVHTR